MSCRKVDLLIGGLTEDPKNAHHSSSTKAYYRDDLTWCTMRAKPLPVWQNIFTIIKKELWVIIFILGYLHGLLFFVLTRYDDDYDHTRRDVHYTTLIVSLPIVIGFNQSFQPKSALVRSYYGLVVLGCLVGVVTFTTFLIKVLTVPIDGNQVSTIEEIIGQNFELVGDRVSYTKIVDQTHVRS